MIRAAPQHARRDLPITDVGNALVVVVVLLSAACGSADRDDTGTPQSTPHVATSEEGLHFADVTEQAGINFVHSIGDDSLSNLVESSGGGVAFLDFDQDGFLDLYVANGAFVEGFSNGPKPREELQNRLYRNRGDGTFADVTNRARVSDEGYGMGVVTGDYDNDGYPDIYVTNYGSNVLYHNQGNGTFSDVTERSGVGGDDCSVGAVWFDYDNDGLLDLYVGNYIDFDPEYEYFYTPDGFPGPEAYAGQPDVLYRNRGDGTFEDVTQHTGLYRSDGRAMGVGAADYDHDGFVDVYVANDAMENSLYRNEGGTSFRDMGLIAGVAYNHRGNATSSMSVDFADYDGDGDTDIYLSDMSYSALYRNEGQGLFADMTYQAGIASSSGQFVGWSAAFLDYDNDGDVDIFQVNGDLHHLYGQEDQLFENLGDGNFSDVALDRGRYFEEELVGRGAAFGDYDNDGDVDAFIVNLNDQGVLLRNEGGNENNWLLLQLEGRVSNRDAIGARVTVIAGGKTQVLQKTGYLSQSDPRMHFGLGVSDSAEQIEIVWPSGTVQTLENVRAGQVLKVIEP